MEKSGVFKLILAMCCFVFIAVSACFMQSAAFAEDISVLNPRADQSPIIANALAGRVKSLEGKTVWVNGSDANMNAGNEIMIMVARELAKAVPGIKVVYLTDRYGNAATDSVDSSIRIAKNPTDAHSFDIYKEAGVRPDAVVTGLGY